MRYKRNKRLVFISGRQHSLIVVYDTISTVSIVMSHRNLFVASYLIWLKIKLAKIITPVEMNYPSEANNFLADHVALLNHSYQELLGDRLMADNYANMALAKALFYAPFVLVSHNTDADPVFNYANLKALELFGFSWEEFTQLPSRLSAEPSLQSERDKAMAEVSRKGYLANYQSVRIAKSGARFLLRDAVIWNVFDSKGNYAGQAAWFADWRFLQ